MRTFFSFPSDQHDAEFRFADHSSTTAGHRHAILFLVTLSPLCFQIQTFTTERSRDSGGATTGEVIAYALVGGAAAIVIALAACKRPLRVGTIEPG